MAAGVVYSGNAFDVERELYQTKTGYRLSGGFIPANGEIETLSAKAELPTLCPIQLDFNARSFKVVRNIKVYAAAESGATTIKIEKGSFAKVGDKYYLSANECITVSAIDKTNADYDSLTVGTLTDAITIGSVLTIADTIIDTAVRNIKVYEAAESGATTVKIEKGSSAKVDDKFYLSESEYITVSAIDKTNADYDSLTVGALTAAIAIDTILTTEDTTTSFGTHAVANSLLYTKKKIESGMSVTALGQAYEIDEANLYIPLRAEDKAGLTSRFMFV